MCDEPTLRKDNVPDSWHGHSVFPWAESSKSHRQRKRGNNNHNRLVSETDLTEREKEALPERIAEASVPCCVRHENMAGRGVYGREGATQVAA